MKFGYFKDSKQVETEQGEKAEELEERDDQYYKDLVTKLIKENPLMLFSKTHCQYSRRLKKILNTNMLAGQYEVYELDRKADGDKVQKAIEELSEWKTVPAMFIGGEIAGGDEDVE
jgi:glutaredoxin-related protein